jgi:hypothetical protein
MPNARGTGPLLALDTCYSVVVIILDAMGDIFVIWILAASRFLCERRPCSDSWWPG